MGAVAEGELAGSSEGEGRGEDALNVLAFVLRHPGIRERTDRRMRGD